MVAFEQHLSASAGADHLVAKLSKRDLPAPSMTVVTTQSNAI